MTSDNPTTVQVPRTTLEDWVRRADSSGMFGIAHDIQMYLPIDAASPSPATSDEGGIEQHAPSDNPFPITHVTSDKEPESWYTLENGRFKRVTPVEAKE